MSSVVEASPFAPKEFNAQGLVDVIEQSYLLERREPSDRAKKSFAPSGLGYGSGQCPRQWFYAFTGGVMRGGTHQALEIASMASGTEAHERLQNVFERAGILVEKEKRVENDSPPILGFADLIINWQGEQAVGEIKTTRQESFVSKRSKAHGAGYHLLQVLIYMKVLELNKGFLLYENKNQQNLLLVPVVWNAFNIKFINNTFDWMNKVYENWQSGEMPKRPFKSEKSLQCKACDFKEHCWSGEEGTVALPSLVVPK